MKEDILSICHKNHVLLDGGLISILLKLSLEENEEILKNLSKTKKKILTKRLFLENSDSFLKIIKNEEILKQIQEEKEKIKIEMKKEGGEVIKTKSTGQLVLKDKKKCLGGKIKVLYSLANVTRKITPQDFIIHFRNRFQEMKKFLQDRKELENLTSINKIGNKRQLVSVIGIVFSKRVTKNKNIILEIEDLTGRLKVLINHEKEEIYQKAKEILLDDILGFKGFGDEEILFVNDLVYPEAFLSEKTFLSLDENIALISDLHLGSKKFLKENFEKFIEWLNGKWGSESQKKEAAKTKTVFIVGDNIDGIGVYPGQEEDLEIKDIKQQYLELAELLKKIKKEVTIIICPGQHDAVRVAEPQPPIGRDYAEALYEMENVILVSNPSLIEINDEKNKGLKFQLYHGASMHSFVDEIESLRLTKTNETPNLIVKEILKRRHLSPTHSTSVYIPSEKIDPLLINETPDVILTGDMHRTDTGEKNNIQIICSSCWQSKTAFEEKVGNNPDPCKVPLLNLKTRKLKILDFSDFDTGLNSDNFGGEKNEK
jgi:DNA polymerase II small subunit